MQALADTAPSPSPPSTEGEPAQGAKSQTVSAPEPGRERFIPVSRYGLRARLVDMLAEGGIEANTWERALDCLAAWRHQDYRKRLLDLLEDYLPFSPDSDTASLIAFDAKTTAMARDEFIAGVERLLVQANYLRLAPEDLQRILLERSPHGLSLKVDMGDFDELVLYYRGTGVEMREERNPWRFFLTRERLEVPVFQRLFLVLKLKPVEARAAEIAASSGIDHERALKVARKRRERLPASVSSDHIYVKMFKRIPQADLEMLFPNTRVRFRPLDKLKLAVTAGGGTVAGVAGTATKLLAATNPFTLAFGIFGLSAVIFRQAMKFFHTRNHYMMVLAQNLYFCSLANNLGALTLIADGAEEEDVKEDMLLYAFLARAPAQRDGLAAIKADVIRFLETRCGAKVDFDAEDSLRRLLADGLVISDDKGRLAAIAPDAARAHLDRLWDRLLDVDSLDRAASGKSA
jgi:hypothetical protein